MRKPKQIFTGPWYPWFVDDVMNSERVKTLSLAEEGAYRRALDSAWKEGSIPADPAVCAKVIGNGCTPRIAKKVLDTCFVPMPKDSARMVNQKLEKVRAMQEEKNRTNSENGRKGAEKRWKQKSNGDSPANSPAIPGPIAKAWQSETNTNTEKEEEFKAVESVGQPPIREIFVGTVTAELTKRMEVQSLPSKLQWQNGMNWAFENGFTSDHFLEAYDLLKLQNWRDGPVKPNHVVDNLPNLEKLRKEIEKQNEPQNRQTVKTRGSSSKPDERSTQSVLESIGVFND